MNLQSTIRLSPDQVSSNLNGEAAILNLKSGVYFGLDPVGTVVWKIIEHPATVESIRSAMLQRFDVDPERCEKDLFELLGKLSEHGLIEVSDAE